MLDFRLCVTPGIEVEEYQPWLARRPEYHKFLEEHPFPPTKEKISDWWQRYENAMFVLQLCAGTALEMQEYLEKVDLYEKGKIAEKEVDDTLDRLIQEEINFALEND